MREPMMNDVLHQYRVLVSLREMQGLDDDQLLDRFVRQEDEAAFTVLMQRHGGMVLGVCRRVLRHAEDAADACQATFLVLARKASSICRRASLPSWLHGVAYRVSLRLRADPVRRFGQLHETVEPAQADTTSSVTWQEAVQVLDEELDRLPAHYRGPLVLCYLEGKTQDEAAQQLGWTLGAFRGRLERGRDKLRRRLVQRGVTVPAVLLGVGLTTSTASAAVPAALVNVTVQAAVLVAAQRATAAGVVSAKVAALTEGVLKAMLLSKLKTAAAVVLTISLACFGAGAMLLQGDLRSSVWQGQETLPQPGATNEEPLPAAAKDELAPAPPEKDDPMQKALTVALGDRFEFVESRFVELRKSQPYWLATVRAKQEGEFVLRCAIKYEYSPEVRKQFGITLMDGANLTYHFVIGKAGSKLIAQYGPHGGTIYPQANVGDHLVIPLRMLPSDTGHRFEMPKDGPEAETAIFVGLKETWDRGQQVKPGQADFEVNHGAKDVLTLVSSEVSSTGNRVGTRTSHHLSGVFDVVGAGKFNLKIDFKTKGRELNDPPVEYAFEVVPKGQPLTVLVSRWDIREFRNRGKDEKPFTNWSTETLNVGVHPARVGDRLALSFGGYSTPGTEPVKQHPTVEVVKRPFALPAGPHQEPGVPPPPNKKDPTAKLLKDLANEDRYIVAVAIDLLGERKAEQAIPKLIDLLADGRALPGSDNWVGGRAANALTAITGRPFSVDQKEWKKWWEANKAKYDPK